MTTYLSTQLVSAAETATTEASGVLSLAWLLVALPLLGAAVLLLGGRRTDAWGHWLGVAMPALRRSCSALAAVLRPARSRAPRTARSIDLFTWIPVGTFQRRRRAAGRPAVDVLRAAGHLRRLAHPHLLRRLHGARPATGAGSSPT